MHPILLEIKNQLDALQEKVECLIQCVEENMMMGLDQEGGMDTEGNGMGGLDT